MKRVTREEYNQMTDDCRKNYQSFEKNGKCIQWKHGDVEKEVSLFKGDKEGVLIVARTGDRYTRLPLSKTAAMNLILLLMDNYKEELERIKPS